MRFEDTTWSWGRSHPLRYLLVSEEHGEQTLWAKFTDVDRLFVDPVPRREVLTLVACAPTGRLLKAIRAADREPVPFGDLGLAIEFPYDDENSWGGYAVHYADLDDAVILGARVAESDARLFDVTVEAEVTSPTPASPRWSCRTEPENAEIYLQNGNGSGIGTCRRVTGLYVERPEKVSPPPPHLIGCEPTEQLLSRLSDTRYLGNPVELWALDRAGRFIHRTDGLWLHIGGSRPSLVGGALVDVALREGPSNGPRAAAREVWEAWHIGAPKERNEWARFSEAGREEWLRLTTATVWQREAPTTWHLDGRYVTDPAGLKCALGEAVAGPGRHLLQCWGVLKGCPCGGDFWATPGTKLIWHDAEVARQALASVSVDAAGELSYFQSTVQMLEHFGVTVELR